MRSVTSSLGRYGYKAMGVPRADLADYFYLGRSIRGSFKKVTFEPECKKNVFEEQGSGERKGISNWWNY